MAVSKDFAKRLAASKVAQKRLKKAAKARPSEYSIPEIENGTYICRIGVSTRIFEKTNCPIISIHWAVVEEGEYKGVHHQMDFWLEGDDEDKVQKTWDNLSRAIQVLANLDEEDMESFAEWSMSDLIGVLDEIDKAAPLCKVRIKNWKGEKSSGLNAYFNELVDSVDAEDAEEDEEEEQEEKKPAKKSSKPAKKSSKKAEQEEDEDDSDDEDEEDSDDEEEEEEEKPAKKSSKKPAKKAKQEEEDDEDTEDESEDEDSEDDAEKEDEFSVEKGDIVSYKPPRKKTAVDCKVLSVNVKKETVSLVQEDDKTKKYTDVSWNDIEVYAEE